MAIPFIFSVALKTDDTQDKHRGPVTLQIHLRVSDLGSCFEEIRPQVERDEKTNRRGPEEDASLEYASRSHFNFARLCQGSLNDQSWTGLQMITLVKAQVEQIRDSLILVALSRI